MECREAQAQLGFTTLGQDAVNAPDAHAALRHAAECDVCRRALESQRRFDREVARAMTDVPLPTGLNQRLQSAVSDLNPRPESARAKSRPHRQRTAWRWVSGGVVALLLPLLVWSVLQFRAPMLNEASVHQLAELDLNVLPVESHSLDVAPAGWNARREIQFGDAARLAPVNGASVPVLAFMARVDRRSPPVSGFLIRMPVAQWRSNLDATSFSSATIQYAPFGTWVVWREADTVHVCVLRGDAHAMERFRNVIASGRDLT